MSLSFHIRSSALPSHAIVAAFRGSEGISRPYAFDIYLTVPHGEELDLDDAPGARISLTIEGASGTPGPVTFEGMIATIELRAIGNDTHNCLYIVRLVPNLWQLSLTKHSRIFTKQSIPDVIKQVLQDEGIDNVDMRLRRHYEVEEHVCQYRESSLNFIHRWMEREGLYYFFEQTDSGEKLVITDDKSTSVPSRILPIPYQPGGDGDSSAGAHLDLFTARHSSLPATVRFMDYDYNKPMLDVTGSSSVSPIGVGEQVTYGNRFFTPDKGTALATIRAEDLRAQAKSYHGGGQVAGITSGHTFLVEGHPRLQLNTSYLAVSVEHFGYVEHAAKAWGKYIPHEFTSTYRVDLTAIEASQQYRHPELAPWPRVDGYENAIIDGPASSEYAQIDEHGRYAVKFKFDEGTLKGGKASTFVRKVEPHAGTVEGWHFPERKGAEIVCAFMAGDPDRPIIVGAVPTAIHPSPVTSANHTQNVIQTGGLNRFELEDLSGQQRITMSTPHAQTHILMGNPRDGHEFIAKTQGNSLHHTDINHDQYVGANCTINVVANHTETVGATLQQTVTSAVTHTWNSTHDLTVASAATHTHNTSLTHTVNGPHTVSTNGPHTHTTNGPHNHTTNGPHTQTTTGEHQHETEGDHKLTIGGMFKNAVSGVVDWSFEAAKSEKVAGAVNNVFLGLKNEFVGGVKIDTTVGAEITLSLASSTEITPEKTEAHGIRLKINGSETEMKGMETHLKGMEEKLAGLEEQMKGLSEEMAGSKQHLSGSFQIEFGMYNADGGMYAVVSGLVELA